MKLPKIKFYNIEYDDGYFTTVNIHAGLLNINATWTQELAQDLHAYHNIDAERELVAILSEQMAEEIDREILRQVREEARSYPKTPLLDFLDKASVPFKFNTIRFNQDGQPTDFYL